MKYNKETAMLLRETVNILENELSVEEMLAIFGYGCAVDVQHNYSFRDIVRRIEVFFSSGRDWGRLHSVWGRMSSMYTGGDTGSEITENILEYILGGDALFAVKQDKSGNGAGGIVWYRVVSSKGRGSCYFVSRVVGSSEEYIGYFFKDEVGYIREMRVSKKQPECSSEYAKPLIVVLNSLKKYGRLPGDGIVHILSNGRCSRCGRIITNLESIKYGL